MQSSNNIKYVALSQSQNLFDSDGGIVWYGKIKDIHLLKRNEIYGRKQSEFN